MLHSGRDIMAYARKLKWLALFPVTRVTKFITASLALFASVALLFWYVLRLVIALSGRD